MSHPDVPTPRSPFPELTISRRSLRRGALVILSPIVAYALVRPLLSSDAAGLAIAAAIPILYSIVLGLVRRRVDPIAGLAAVGFALACLISVLTGAGSLPLKLHEAFITFGVGLVLLLASLIHRPLPVTRWLRVAHPDGQLDGALGAMIGAFLILHALLHLALAVSLSTGSYLIAGRAINWGTIALGALGLTAFLRRSGARR